VPTLVDTLMHPRRTPPPPIDVDLARVMGVGTAVWGAAAAVVGVLWLLDVAPLRWFAVCVSGVLLGIVGVLWARRNGRLSPDGTGAMIAPAPHHDEAREA
jgi:Flp pilus assembly protein TadB